MKNVKVITLVFILAMFAIGCTPSVKMVMSDGLPAPDNIITFNTSNGLHITQRIIRVYSVREGDERLMLKEYLDAWAPCTIVPKDPPPQIFFHITVQNPNKVSYKADMEHVIERDNGKENLTVSKTVYKGDLSFKEIISELPFSELNGRKLKHRFVICDAEGNLKASLPFFKYIIKGGGAVSRISDSCFSSNQYIDNH